MKKKVIVKKGGGGLFEAHLEQPLLSPTTEEATPAQRRGEIRGKERAEEQENNIFELLTLIKEIRDEMRGRDEQLREELRWRDNHQDEETWKKENNLTKSLQQRDNEWREDLSERDRALRAEFRERGKAFINEQLKRDWELLKILEVREKEIEKNLLQKAYAFGYLYKEHQKEIKVTI